MDRRQKKTRQAVYKAFTGLLEKKEYSDITVQEIIDAADIGRSTFYAHFETKAKLLDALCSEIFEHVFAEVQTKENTHDFTLTGRNLNGKVTHILYHVRENKRYIKGLLSCDGAEMFMRSFRKNLERVFADELDKTAFEAPRGYMLNHMVCDFAETVRWWMRNDSYSTEEIAGFFMETTPFNEKKDNAAAKAYNY